MFVFAAKAPVPAARNTFKKNLEERRNMLEQARTTRVKHIKQELEKISKREVEFSRSLVHDLVPFRVVWNEAAVSKVKEFIPFTFEEKEKEKETEKKADTSDHFVEREL
jgi:hypothetical protein